MPGMQVTPARYRQIAYAALAVCTLIVFTGAAVRLTGSGLGCPDWPRCDGSRLTPELHIHGVIEFSNRVMTSVVAIPCLAAAILAWLPPAVPARSRVLAPLLPLGVLGQAVMGGLTVLYGLAPGWVIAHFLLSMALLVACVALVWRATYEPGERPRATDRLTTWSVRALLVPGAVTLAPGHDRDRGRPARGRRGHRRRGGAADLARLGDARLGDPPARRAGHVPRPGGGRRLVPRCAPAARTPAPGRR